MTIITKGAHPRPGSPRPRVRPECIDEDLAESLERLGLDRVDVYLLHRDNKRVPVGPIVQCLTEHQRARRIGAFGGSNWSHGRTSRTNAYAADHGLTPFALSSPNLSLAVPNGPMWSGCVSLNDHGWRWHRRTQFPLLSWSSQARGFFSGRYDPADPAAAGDVARVYYNQGNWDRLARCRELAGRRGCEPIQIALAWVLNQPFPVAAVVGPQTIEELKSCVAAAAIELSEQELRWLREGTD